MHQKLKLTIAACSSLSLLSVAVVMTMTPDGSHTVLKDVAAQVSDVETLADWEFTARRGAPRCRFGGYGAGGRFGGGPFGPGGPF